MAAVIAAGMLWGCNAPASEPVSTSETGSETTKTEAVQVSASAESSLYGQAYTNAKSTLKAEYGVSVSYDEDSKAVIRLQADDGSAIDDSLVDTSNASVTLLDGDAYTADQFIFSGNELGSDIRDGVITYRLKEGDIEPSNGDYFADNGGREWSALGSDGKGVYYFNLQVSGIRYDGQEIDPVDLRAIVNIFGYDYTADAQELYPQEIPVDASFEELQEKPAVQDKPVITWQGDGDKPILCDELADRFYIVWPEGQDASNLSSEDITITMKGRYGDELTLQHEKDYFTESTTDETQIVVSYQYWAYAPVYTDMEISVSKEAVTGAEADFIANYDIASVYVNMVQYGGGMDRDNTVIAIQIVGYDDIGTVGSLGMPFFYTLVTEDGKFYAEDEEGKAYLTDDHEQAKQFDASGEEDMAPRIIENTIYFTEHFGRTMEMEVDGETVVFMMNYGYGFPMISPELKVKDGYTPMKGMMDHHKWAWQSSLQEGWTAIDVTPMEGRYTWNVEKGRSEDFDAFEEDVTWSVLGASSEDTKVDKDGILTVGEDETAASFALICQDTDGNYGGITVRVK